MHKKFLMSIKFTDAVKYHQDLPHQNDAWNFLQASVNKEILDEFARRYRNQKVEPTLEGLPIPGVDLIKEFEGCHLEAYPDPLTKSEPITIGWGSTRDQNGKPFKLGAKISQKTADDLLISQIRNEFLPPLTQIPYWNEMNMNQRSALLSFAYNLGARFYGSSGFNTITRVLKNKQWNKVPDALYLYRNPGTNVESGLARRRKAEGKLWMS